MQPESWTLANEAQSIALGLPPRSEGYGLIMFQDGDRRFTWAGDAIMVAALEEREGDVPDWDAHFRLEAEGWPEPRDDGRLTSLLWRARG